MSDSCLFCRILRREISADIVYEDGDVMAFRDVSPQAPVHVLVIPKRHISTLNELSDGKNNGESDGMSNGKSEDKSGDDGNLIGTMVLTAQRLAVDLGVSESGYRLVMNCNADAGQTVFHIHLHILGGRSLGHLG